MNKRIGILLMLAALSAQAEPDAMVQAVQMPAWLQREGNTTPLRVGTALQNGDKLLTGSNARIYLQTADGSTVKLGEKAELNLQGLTAQKQTGSVFSAALDVVRGAFRFTTSALAKARNRDISIKVAGATLGIRGTDVWGKSGIKMDVATLEKAMNGKAVPEADKQKEIVFDTVCLIEGRIEVQNQQAPAFVMDKPQSFYVMPQGASPLPVAELSSEQLGKWATQTEIAQPAAQPGGRWKVNLLTAADQASALKAYDQWRDAGYDVRLHPVEHEGGRTYMLRLVQLSSRGEAEKLAIQLKGTLGAENPSASR
jgi:hypothetical protein